MHKNLTSQDIHICLVSDNKYMIHTGVVIASVLSNSNPRDKYHFYILASGITKRNKNKLLKLKKIRDFEILYPEINYERLEIFNKVKRSAWVPIDTFNRLLMPDLLPEVDKAIFLDSDIVVMHDIAALYAMNIDDCYIAGVEDLNYAGLTKMLGYDSIYTYINSGIYLMNLKVMRENNYYEHMISVMEKDYKKYTIAEQCVINSCFHEHIKRIPHKWNMYHIFLDRPHYNFRPYDKEAWNDGFRNPAIVHFVGPDKPWNFRSTHPYRDQYLKYLKKTPWRGLYFINKIKRIGYNICHIEKRKIDTEKCLIFRLFGIALFSKKKDAHKKTINFLFCRFSKKI